MLLLTILAAQAKTEIGAAHTVGAGIATGSPLLNGTVKFYVKPHAGVALYLGTSFLHHELRAAWQSEFIRWGEGWSWGQLGLYWHADVRGGIDAVPYYGVYPTAGAGGGIGFTLQFGKFPLEVFVDAGLAVNVLHGYCGAVASDLQTETGIDTSAACWVGGIGAGGARYYF